MMKIWLLFLLRACVAGASSSDLCTATNTAECTSMSGRSALQTEKQGVEKLVLHGDATVSLRAKEMGVSDILSMVMEGVGAITTAAMSFKAAPMEVAAGVSTFVEDMIKALKPLIDDIPNMTPETFEEAMKKDMEKMEEDLAEAEADFKKFVDEGVEGYFLSGMGKILDRLEETAEYVLPPEIAKSAEAYLHAVSEILMGLGDTWDDFVNPNPPNQTAAALNLARVVNNAVASLLPEEIQADMDYQIISTSLDQSLKVLSEQVMQWSFELAGKNVCSRKTVFNEDYVDPNDCTRKKNGNKRIGYELDTVEGTKVCLPTGKREIGLGRKEEGMNAKKLTGVRGARYPNCKKTGSHTKQAFVKDLKQTKCFADCPQNGETKYVMKDKKNQHCLAACPDDFPIVSDKGFCGKTEDAYDNYAQKKNAAILQVFSDLVNYGTQVYTAAVGKEDLEVIEGAVAAVGAISGAIAKIHAPSCSV